MLTYTPLFIIDDEHVLRFCEGSNLRSFDDEHVLRWCEIWEVSSVSRYYLLKSIYNHVIYFLVKI